MLTCISRSSFGQAEVRGVRPDGEGGGEEGAGLRQVRQQPLLQQVVGTSASAAVFRLCQSKDWAEHKHTCVPSSLKKKQTGSKLKKSQKKSNTKFNKANKRLVIKSNP